MVAAIAWADRPRIQRFAIGVMLLSSVNLFQFLLFGPLGVVGNQMLYVMVNGSAPPRPRVPGGDTRGPDYWFGHFLTTIPAWYFIATALVYLAVVCAVTAVPRLTFASASVRTVGWRTTPGFLASLGVFFALGINATSQYYNQPSSPLDPYVIGIYAAGLGAAISLVTFLRVRRARRATAGRAVKRPVRKAAKRG